LPVRGAYVPNCGYARDACRPRFNPNEETMGSTPNGSAKSIDATGAVLPSHLKIDRDGASRASVTGRL
jgi:hypothetical protein